MLRDYLLTLVVPNCKRVHHLIGNNDAGDFCQYSHDSLVELPLLPQANCVVARPEVCIYFSPIPGYSIWCLCYCIASRNSLRRMRIVPYTLPAFEKWGDASIWCWSWPSKPSSRRPPKLAICRFSFYWTCEHVFFCFCFTSCSWFPLKRSRSNGPEASWPTKPLLHGTPATI